MINQVSVFHLLRIYEVVYIAGLQKGGGKGRRGRGREKRSSGAPGCVSWLGCVGVPTPEVPRASLVPVLSWPVSLSRTSLNSVSYLSFQWISFILKLARVYFLCLSLHPISLQPIFYVRNNRGPQTLNYLPKDPRLISGGLAWDLDLSISGVGCECWFAFITCVLSQFSHVRFCDPMDWSPPGSSVHGLLQEKILEWVAIPFSRGSSWPRDPTQVSYVFCIGGQVLYH